MIFKSILTTFDTWASFLRQLGFEPNTKRALPSLTKLNLSKSEIWSEAVPFLHRIWRDCSLGPSKRGSPKRAPRSSKFCNFVFVSKVSVKKSSQNRSWCLLVKISAIWVASKNKMQGWTPLEGPNLTLASASLALQHQFVECVRMRLDLCQLSADNLLWWSFIVPYVHISTLV